MIHEKTHSCWRFFSNSDISAYKQKVCPAGGSGDSNSNSKDSQDQGNDDNANGNDDYYTPYNFARYGDILAGYGYATEPCVCYTDGSGCSCDSQDENTAVRNVATYGPAVVCVDASDWQDYQGGIMSSSSGCSQDYLDVNHCVQVVGYAFSSSEGGNSGSSDRKSGDEHNSGDSNDREDRNLGSGSADKDVSYDGYVRGATLAGHKIMSHLTKYFISLFVCLFAQVLDCAEPVE